MCGAMASAQQQQQQGHTEYRVRLADASSKKYHVMRFKPPHKCDLEKLVNPTLDRKVKQVKEDEKIPESGEGSEYGRKWREEARKRKRGYASRKEDPDEMPWVLKEKKRGGAHFIGRKEGTINTSSSYFILSVGQDGAFEAFPIKNWYDFVPPVKYNYLDADEAEERFERRNKTLNYFSIMLSKKMKDQEEEGGDSKGTGEERGGEEATGSSGSKKWKKKQTGKDTVLLLTDSSSGLSSDDSETEGTSKQKDDSRKKKKKRKACQEIDSEAGEETDEGEIESREVDYMSESSSDSEQEFQAKQALKEAPKDDEEVDRKEEGEIDKGFTESSSSEDEELTEEGKEIKALLSIQSGTKDTNSDIEDEEEEEDYSMKQSSSQGGKSSSRSTTPTSGVEGRGTPKKKHSSHHKSSKHGLKREREHEKGTGSEIPDSSGARSSETPADEGVADKGAESQPPSKKQRTEFSSSSITEEEVKRYLLRRPITSKDLVRKFTSKKTEMDRNRIVEVLSRIINNLKDVDKQIIKGKMYLSLKKQVE